MPDLKGEDEIRFDNVKGEAWPLAIASTRWLSEISMNRYPTEEELNKIEQWPHNDFRGLMDFIHHIWEYAEWGWSEKKLKDAIKYDISTAGWSGNEDIIRALEKNPLFWVMCWEKSRKGGHYIFHVR